VGGIAPQEHGKDGDECEDGDITYYGGCGVGCAYSEGSDISDEDFGWETVEEVHGQAGADYAQEDDGCAGVTAFDEEDQDHEGGTYNGDAGL